MWFVWVNVLIGKIELTVCLFRGGGKRWSCICVIIVVDSVSTQAYFKFSGIIYLSLSTDHDKDMYAFYTTNYMNS